MNNNILFCCYSVPLRDYLCQNNNRYEICGINPNTGKMFWVFIKTDRLNRYLEKWSRNK